MLVGLKTFYKLQEALQFVSERGGCMDRVLAEDIGSGRKRYLVGTLRAFFQYCRVVGKPKLYEVLHQKGPKYVYLDIEVEAATRCVAMEGNRELGIYR
jgi:hypothetical protein